MSDPWAEIQSAIDGAAQVYPEPRRKLFVDFSREFLGNADPALIQVRGAAALVGLATDAFEFASERPDAICLRVTNSERSPGRTLIQGVQSDRPFLVDTTRLLLRSLELREDCFLHPTIALARDATGALQSVGSGALESMLLIEVAPRVSDPQGLEAELRNRLEQLAAVTDDHSLMIRCVRELAANVEFAGHHIDGRTLRADKIRRFLDWVVDGNFVFLGARRYVLHQGEAGLEAEVRHGGGLGILRDDGGSRLAEPKNGAGIPGELRDQLEDPRIILLGKSRVDSTIHRAGRLDRLLVKEHDGAGTLTGFTVMLGLFTFRALRTPGSQIPLLAERLGALLDQNRVASGSHRYKAIVAAFDSTPAEFLLASEPGAIAQVIEDIVAGEGQDEPRLILSADANRRSLYVAVVLPRHRYRDDLHASIEGLLTERLGAAYMDHRTSFLEEDTALLSYFCTAAEERFELPDRVRLEAAIRERIARWQDRLAEGLIRAHGDASGLELAARYEAAFPEAYRVETHPLDAVRDVAELEKLAERRVPEFALYFDATDEGVPRASTVERTCKLKVFLPESRLLSDLLPVIDRFGIRVVDARQAEIAATERPPAVSVSLRIVALGEDQADLDNIAPRLGEALRAVLTDVVPDDALNGLVLTAGLEWREVDCLRAYLAYFNQIQGTLTLSYVRQVLLGNPIAVRLLLRTHHARLEPGTAPEQRVAAETAVGEEFEEYRGRVTSLNEDRALGGVHELIEATLRTSFFSTNPGSHRIAMKFDPGAIRDLPAPHPYREIFVHGSGVTGIHIRGGPIARGGLRWSDRADDVRTEVLGLMRTQMLKNGLIVPVGAKGGFLTRGEGASSDPRGYADAQYREFIAGLLDLTDDLAPDGSVIAPQGVHRRDESDPYLVVAADKGTAHLSDTANAVALERGFWLGDAFASGGSNGYDHKKYAITARGAWECVLHHFAELGIDPERDVYTAAGIGDMSGDVFGNGLLLARRARMLAAFDHRHVFLDPDPDPEVAWQERLRLFELPRSNWGDYDPDKISEGGGVYPRSAKRISLSRAARESLGITQEHLTGEALVRAVLRMPVDLFWNGGIGTYVKASDESHADVRDRATDAVRIDGRELRARVFGEGGNLGLTQRGRNEAAATGVRLNMDAIDNSAGVDLSDHEVNFKVLLAPLVRSGELAEAERNEQLSAVADEACERVLAHNRAQALCVSLDEVRSRADPEPFLWAIEYLCGAEGLDPAEGQLPDAATLAARGGGLLRPELSWLLGLAKLHLRGALVAGNRASHPCTAPLYQGYFPDTFNEGYRAAVESHRLRPEITALAITNRMIDLSGITLIPSLVRELDVAPDTAGMVALLALEILADFDYREPLLAVATDLEREDVYAALLDSDSSVRAVARLLARRPWEEISRADVARWSAGLAALRDMRGEFPTDNAFARGDERQAALREKGFSEELAADISSTMLADLGLSLLWVSERSGAQLPAAAQVYAHVGEHSGLNWVYERLARSRPSDSWDRIELSQLRCSLIALHEDLAEKVLEGPHDDPQRAAAAFLERRATAVARVRSLQQRAAGNERPSHLAVVANALERLRGEE